MEKINKAIYPRYFFGEINNSLLNKINRYHKIALFLDYDGTLVPIQKDPAQCFLSEETKKILKSLVDSKNCCLSVLSGRMLSDIRNRVGIQKIYYGGNHGIDIAGPGMRYTHPKASSTRPIILKIKHLLKKEIADIKGAWLEDKKFTLTLHFRAVKRGDISSVKRAFYKITKRFLEEKLLTVIKGKKVLELTPDISWDKGNAIFYILKRLKNKWFPIYIGDDKTDENAFRALNKNGITIRVGKSAKTAADYYLKGYWEVPRALDMLTITTQSAGIYEKKSS